VRLAGLLHIRTVAEYVTDGRTAELLRSIGVDYGQGWAFERARPLEESLSSYNDTIRKNAG
jgi:EAL domain-containing protein (putative c-di-GMP-specific phosphodiesterase class I)